MYVRRGRAARARDAGNENKVASLDANHPWKRSKEEEHKGRTRVKGMAAVMFFRLTNFGVRLRDDDHRVLSIRALGSSRIRVLCILHTGMRGTTLLIGDTRQTESRV